MKNATTFAATTAATETKKADMYTKIIGHLATNYKTEMMNTSNGPCKVIKGACIFDANGKKNYIDIVFGGDAEVLEAAGTKDMVQVEVKDDVWQDKSGNSHFKARKVWKTSEKTGSGYYACTAGHFAVNLTKQSMKARSEDGFEAKTETGTVAASSRGIRV